MLRAPPAPFNLRARNLRPSLRPGTLRPVSGAAGSGASRREAGRVTAGQGQPVKVRLSGIDAPEKSLEFGAAAPSAMVCGREVEVEISRTDRDSRILAEASLHMPVRMVAGGMVCYNVQYVPMTSLARSGTRCSSARSRPADRRFPFWGRHLPAAARPDAAAPLPPSAPGPSRQR